MFSNSKLVLFSGVNVLPFSVIVYVEKNGNHYFQSVSGMYLYIGGKVSYFVVIKIPSFQKCIKAHIFRYTRNLSLSLSLTHTHTHTHLCTLSYTVAGHVMIIVIENGWNSQLGL